MSKNQTQICLKSNHQFASHRLKSIRRTYPSSHAVSGQTITTSTIYAGRERKKWKNLVVVNRVIRRKNREEDRRSRNRRLNYSPRTAGRR